jgi:hypothetical protein
MPTTEQTKQQWPADKTERVPLAELIPHARNSRTHTQAQIEAVARSMAEFGFVNPVLRDEVNQIIAGHARVLAAELLVSRGDERFREAPCMTARGWTDAQKRAYIIADNRLAETGSGWDDEVLKAELADLAALGFDATLTGFTADDLAAFATKRDGNSDPDAIPPVPETPISRAGDLWRLGDHWLICGDATDPEVVARVLAGQEAQVCITDPPYGIGYAYKTHDDSNNNANAQLVSKVFALAPAAKVWTPGSNNLARDLTRFGKAKMLIWHKGFAAAGNGLGGASTIEPVLVLNPKRKKLANDYLEFKTDREEIDGQSLRELHPCPKPVALFAHLIEAFAPPKGIVYEPFGGSSTTMIACQLTGRVCRSVEIDPAYVDVGLRRWMELTGFEAFHEDGRTWTQVVEDRAEKP